MIRDIEDFRKKKAGRQSDGGLSGYLPEEELLALIGQVEEEGMLRAPRHLKGNVFAQLHAERRAAKRRTVFVYRAKVLAAMAAAIAVLILMPDGRAEIAQKPSVRQQAEEEPLAQMALRRRKEVDSNWEKYLAERERGGVRGFFGDINEKVAQFGAELYDRIE